MARAADVDYVVQATDDPAEADFTVNALGGGSGTIESGAGAPSSTPAAIGDHYIDTTNDNAYVAVCTTSAACWKQATGAGGGDLLAANNLSDVANAGTSRTNLGLAIGTDVQAYAAALDSVSGTNTGDEAAASDTVAGVVELATIAEVDTGTDTTRAVTPDALEGSALQAKVDGIEALADVTDVTNVRTAGAPIVTSGAGSPSSTPTAVGDLYVDTTADTVWSAAGTASSADWNQATGAGGGDLLAANNLSDVADAGTSRTNLGLAIGTNVQAWAAVLDNTTASFLIADETNLDAIEALADVTDVTNVTAAGALMDSEVDADIKTLVLPASTTISAFGATVVDDADAATVRATIGADITSASDVDDLTNIAATNQTGTTYTLALTDAHSTIYCSNAAEVTVTIPVNASVAFDVGARVVLLSTGAGGLTLSTTSITLLGSSPNTTVAQNEALYLEKTATDSWAVIGGTAA